MGRLITTYLAASNTLFQRKRRAPGERNPTADSLLALAPAEAEELEHGRHLPADSMERLSLQTGVSVAECTRQIALFLYWKQKSLPPQVAPDDQ